MSDVNDETKEINNLLEKMVIEKITPEEMLVLNNKKYVKPILKWLGGKTQIINNIINNFPKEINNYHEWFLGGGSVLFGLLSSDIKVKGAIYAYDINETLINLYKNIQSNHGELYENLITIINKFNEYEDNPMKTDNIGKRPSKIYPKTLEDVDCKESYYYLVREIYNKSEQSVKNSPVGSAMFIFLNKTCFRGVYRTGPNGFNVPYGRYKNPEIINKDHLDKIHDLIKNVVFIVSDFKESFKNYKDGDFVYLDPPYVPENKTSFVQYNEDGFDLNQHNALFNICKKLNIFMMSNSYTDLILETFSDDKFKIQKINCKRSINSADPSDTTNESIIKNY